MVPTLKVTIRLIIWEERGGHTVLDISCLHFRDLSPNDSRNMHPQCVIRCIGIGVIGSLIFRQL